MVIFRDHDLIGGEFHHSAMRNQTSDVWFQRLPPPLAFGVFFSPFVMTYPRKDVLCFLIVRYRYKGIDDKNEISVTVVLVVLLRWRAGPATLAHRSLTANSRCGSRTLARSGKAAVLPSN